jgi:hypothetical protein
MPTKFPMPIQEAVRDLLMDLLGRGIAVTKAERVFLEDDSVAAVADFVTDTGVVGVVCMADLALAATLGASLTMMPNPVVQDSIRKNAFDEEMLLENLSEVLNIMTRLFNSPDTPHLKLGNLHTLPGELPEKMQKLMAQPAARRDFDVTVEGYGDGKLTLYVR